MDQQQQQQQQQQPQQASLGVPGPAGRRLHIAHRRSPSEMTPMISKPPFCSNSRLYCEALIIVTAARQANLRCAFIVVEQLALQQQIEQLQQQQQQIAGMHQQYVNMGMIPQQQQLPGTGFPPQPQLQGQASMPGMQQHPGAFQFPPQMQQQQQMGVSMNAPTQPASHRRNQSALPNMSNMGPPPAPSSGASAFGDFGQQNQSRETGGQRGGRGGGSGGGGGGAPTGAGHQRRHSLALPEAKKAAELAQQKRTTSGFQFPIPGASGASPTSANRAESPSASDDKGGDSNLLVPNQPGLTARAGNRGPPVHGRSQSMATSAGRGAPQGRGAGGFQFPPSVATNDGGANSPGGQQDFQRRGSNGHGRTSSRNFDGNWRSQGGSQGLQEQQSPMGNFGQTQNPNANVFQPGHRPRGSLGGQSVGSTGQFQFPGQQPQLVQLPQGQVIMQQPQMFGGAQSLNPMQMQQLQALQQAAQLGGQQFGMPGGQPNQSQLSTQQQQRKTLFTPYLPQSNIPSLMASDQLVSGILRVNKKNRSDAYVTCYDLDADIFICGSKDRNRALEGDCVAIELLDVDEVWGQKREKEEKKKRKDISDARSGGTNTSEGGRPRSNSATTNGDTEQPTGNEGGLRRRGSLRQRPTQKKNDDVEVEGQSLLLMEEEEVNDEQKPLYAGHVVAVIERVPGQMFSGLVNSESYGNLLMLMDLVLLGS